MMTATLPPQKQNDLSVWKAVSLAWELGYLIALPAFLFGFGGAYLDKNMHTSPLFLVLGLALALAASTFGVIRKVRIVVASENLPKS